MANASYQERRSQLATYFDHTAAAAWQKLTSDAPVSRIRATVREGRAQMRGTLLDWLPDDLSGRRLLDAGCGTGMFSVEAARRGAEVVAIDLSPTLVDLARERLGGVQGAGTVDFRVGDMLDPSLGRFDYVVAMDSLIHYRAPDMLDMIAALAGRAEHALLVTFAPRTVPLTLMHASGQLFPRSDRSPAIEPIRESTLRRLIARDDRLSSWRTQRTQRIGHFFYTSQALEIVPTETGQR
jgi:magnesium-protoporphyrin O-methyltransferase